jgi:hypothetical protein
MDKVVQSRQDLQVVPAIVEMVTLVIIVPCYGKFGSVIFLTTKKECDYKEMILEY